MSPRTVIGVIVGILLLAAVLVLILNYLGIVLEIFTLVGLCVCVGIIFVLVLILVIMIIAVPTYWVTKETTIDETGTYSIDDVHEVKNESSEDEESEIEEARRKIKERRD